MQTQLESWRQRTNDPLIHPAKLARLTKEQDEQAEKYKKKKGFRGDPWEYHQYLDSDRPNLLQHSPNSVAGRIPEEQQYLPSHEGETR